MLMWSRWETIC